MPKRPAKKSTTPKSASTPPASASASRGSDDGSYEGVRGTKTPTGSRPVPVVAHNHPPEATVPGPFHAAPYEQNPQPGRVTQQPTPTRDRLTKAPKSEGGGSY